MSARQFAGGAAASTLSSGIASGDITIAVASASTWPSSGVFSIVIDRGLAGEEKVLVGSRSGNTLTVTTRGYDGTSAAAHTSGATVECCATATDFQEANDHVNASTNVHGLAGGAAVVGTTTSQTLTNKTLTAPVISTISNTGTLTLPTSTDTLVGRATTETLTNKTLNGATLDATSTIGGVSGTSLAADRTAWTAYSPTWTASVNPSIGNGSLAGAYKQIGKIIYFRILLTAGSTTTFGTGSWSFSLPVNSTISTVNFPVGVGSVVDASPANAYLATAILTSATAIALLNQNAAGPSRAADSTSPITFASGDQILISGVYESV